MKGVNIYSPMYIEIDNFSCFVNGTNSQSHF